MKLTILEMQVLEFVMSRRKIEYKPWYSSPEGLFRPTFFDSEARCGWINRDKISPVFEDLLLGRLAVLFPWSLEDSNDHDLSAPLEIVDVILKNERTHQSEFEGPGNLPLGVDQQRLANLATVTFQDHLQLDFVSLDQPSYELVGFEQS